ncbi:unnamed protein product [Soboliphyme baturini]|uniref:Uncharacterized protein n=1 Tax=Soboliphyme baturini TaxID=241478 RepID=A0A183IBS7_9BILA|nr:unnamed protein product [Soboliphyme baturini]
MAHEEQQTSIPSCQLDPPGQPRSSRSPNYSLGRSSDEEVWSKKQMAHHRKEWRNVDLRLCCYRLRNQERNPKPCQIIFPDRSRRHRRPQATLRKRTVFTTYKAMKVQRTLVTCAQAVAVKKLAKRWPARGQRSFSLLIIIVLTTNGSIDRTAIILVFTNDGETGNGRFWGSGLLGSVVVVEKASPGAAKPKSVREADATTSTTPTEVVEPTTSFERPTESSRSRSYTSVIAVDSDGYCNLAAANRRRSPRAADWSDPQLSDNGFSVVTDCECVPRAVCHSRNDRRLWGTQPGPSCGTRMSNSTANRPKAKTSRASKSGLGNVAERDGMFRIGQVIFVLRETLSSMRLRETTTLIDFAVVVK